MARKQRSRGTGTLFRRAARGPWIASWYDHTGKRRERSTRTTDKAAAERILAKRVAETALRRDGVVDATKDRYAIEGRKPLADHVRDYIAHCRHAGYAKKHVDEKVRHLDRTLDATGATRLGDLTPDALESHLRAMRETGLSARTVNFARQIAVAFMSWCVKTGRAESNRLSVVPKLDEGKDRRRVRRPLTDAELARLLAVADDHGRKAWYMAAAMAGLRRGDLERLTWADVDFAEGTITIRHGKARRLDVVPMHPQLAAELQRQRDASMAMPTAKVFPQAVVSRTVLSDFLRAGLAREEPVTNANGEPVMIGKGKWRRPKMRIVVEDAEGRVIDLHSLRTTLGTNLARAGVAPQLAQKIMRHSDYRTTLKHYTVLGLADTVQAIGRLPKIDSPKRAAATGTDHARPDSDPQLYPRQLRRENMPTGAASRDGGGVQGATRGTAKTNVSAGGCEGTRTGATICSQSAALAQLVELQPSKLVVTSSSLVRRFPAPCPPAPRSFACDRHPPVPDQVPDQ